MIDPGYNCGPHPLLQTSCESREVAPKHCRWVHESPRSFICRSVNFEKDYLLKYCIAPRSTVALPEIQIIEWFFASRDGKSSAWSVGIRRQPRKYIG